MRYFVEQFVFLTISLCYVQNSSAADISDVNNLHTGLSEKIGNFSLELLFHTCQMQPKSSNLIISPMTVWTVLAATAEGAVGYTLNQINYVIRVTNKNRITVRDEYRNIAQWLQVKTNVIELVQINAMFIDLNSPVEQDFVDLAKTYFSTDVVGLDFTQASVAADLLNKFIVNVTQGRIKSVVDESLFIKSEFTVEKVVLVSALYFKGQWTVPFNSSSTAKAPFYNSDLRQIGEVNMMYNRYTYPYANIRELEAQILELPFGNENRLSMLIMLPYSDVSLEKMFYNFNNFTLDRMFEELKTVRENYGDDVVRCFLPRFKIESDINLTPVLRYRLNITDLFDASKARLNHLARWPVHVSKIIHKAEIEVTEEGITAIGVTVAEFSNRSAVTFKANRPFSYMLIEKVTNIIVFGGIYQKPSLY